LDFEDEVRIQVRKMEWGSGRVYSRRKFPVGEGFIDWSLGESEGSEIVFST
jgi:hypothetical protein